MFEQLNYSKEKGVKQMNIRKLKAEEIECRVAQVTKTGAIMLLLYKDARVDQRILDETFGLYGWQRHHQVIDGNLYCTVSVRNPETGEWIEKQDVGTESKTEAEKGQASDSFKRACFNLGIGRELYTAPTIWVNNGDYTPSQKGGTYDRFYVKEISYDNAGNINALTIWNEKLNKQVFKMGETTRKGAETTEEAQKNQAMRNSVDKVCLPTEDGKVTKEQWDRLKAEMERTGIDEQVVVSMFGVKAIKDMTQSQVITALNKFKKTKDKAK